MKKAIQIGKGSFSQVFLMKGESDGSLIARKTFITEKLDLKYIKREIENLDKLKNSYGFIRKLSYKVENDQHILDMDFMTGGSLAGLIDATRKNIPIDGFDTEQEIILAYGIAYLMSKLHEKNMIHRDLKPGNVMLDHNLHPYIGDFNLSREYDNTQNMTRCGTVNYLPPETLGKTPAFTSKSDVFMYGMTLYEIVELKPPYAGLPTEAVAQKVYQHKLPEFTTKHLLNEIVKKCWIYDPVVRPSMSEIASDIYTLAHESGLNYARFDEYVQMLHSMENKPIEEIPVCGTIANLYKAVERSIPFSTDVLRSILLTDIANEQEKQKIQHVLNHCNDDQDYQSDEYEEEEEIIDI